ncbi:putative DNA polymerase zeta catalytic subunit [Hortaea werneckii]|nr:putative DNA polymerase zeta catalytic subunit [Hortaea werneckii]
MLHQSKTASLAATSSSNASGLNPAVEDRTVSRIALDLIDCRQVGATPAYVFHIPHFLLSLLQLLTQVQHQQLVRPPLGAARELSIVFLPLTLTSPSRGPPSRRIRCTLGISSYQPRTFAPTRLKIRSKGAFPESSPRTARNDNIRHSLAILRFSPRITEHSLGRNESTGRRRAFVRVGAKFDLLREAKVLNAYTALHDFCTLLLKVLFHLTQVAAAEQQFQSLLFDLLFCWGSISSDGFNAFGIKLWLLLRGRFIFETNISLLRQQHARMINLLELELDGTRVHLRHLFGDFFTDAKSFVFRATLQVDEQAIRIAINHLCAPPLDRVYQRDCFLKRLPPSLRRSITIAAVTISPSIFASKDFRISSKPGSRLKSAKPILFVPRQLTMRPRQTLKVQYQNTDLLSRRRDQDEALRLCDPEHQALDFELAAPAENGEEVDTEQAGLFRSWSGSYGSPVTLPDLSACRWCTTW